MPFKHPPLCGLTLCAATLTLFLAAAPNGVFAAELDQPQFSEQDAWVYHYKTEKGGSIEESDVDVSIIRSDGDEILVGFKVVGSTHPPREIMYKSDWSHSRGINGAETLVERPFAFPLAIGKTWRVEYTEDNPNVQHAREHLEIPYRVVGWEDVKTAAGKFKALKIEAKGSWTADVLPRTQSNAAIVQNNGQRTLLTQNDVQAARRAEGRIYKVFWYVPDKKRWVKSREETYGSDGVLTERAETELRRTIPRAPQRTLPTRARPARATAASHSS
jgi:hypothetical protein